MIRSAVHASRARIVCVAAVVFLFASSSGTVAANTLPLRLSADKHSFFIGAAVAMTPFRNEPVYTEKLRREFNMIVAENAFKFDAIHPSRTTFNFTDADALVAFAEANDIEIRGHTLVWHQQLPGWLTNGTFSRDEAIEILRNHISTLVGRYKGRIWAWDVVNEAIDDTTAALRTSSFWYRTIGPDYLELAFRFAYEADPDALLYYNDYSAEGLGAKSDAVYNMIADLKSRGVPVDGVGWQMHVLNGFRITDGHRTNARRLADLGLEVSITELDIRINLPTTADKLNQQADSYRDIVNFCLSQPNVKALVMWGFTDKYSWIPGFFQGWGDALIFDTNYQPKPAYGALKDVLDQGLDLAPRVASVVRSGKALLVSGENFDDGAQLLINGEKQRKVFNDETNPLTMLVARKAGKFVQSGDRIQVRNPDGSLSNEIIYP
ncbi:MAG TPA: endo-1,4-beta-xylanase [Blastocatellia bacterium]|nr:endo-1,4-beta-xylanase [Blastocatellia bacterium]